MPVRIAEAQGQKDDQAQPPLVADWRQFLRGERLQRLVERMLAHNRDRRVALATARQAQAQWAGAQAGLWPALSADPQAVRARTPADLSGYGVPVTYNTFQVPLSASWELDLWGRQRNLSEAAWQNFLASGDNQRALAISLVNQLAQALLLDAELTERIELSTQAVSSREQSARIARRRFEVGSAARLDMVQAQGLLAQARQDLQALQRSREQGRLNVALLVGEAVKDEDFLRPVDLDTLDIRLPANLPSTLLLARPDVRAAESRLRAADANIAVARAARFPRISLTAAFGTASTQLSGLFSAGSSAWNLGAGASLPLFDAGRNQAGIDEARAAQDAALANYDKTVQAAFREVADALSAQRSLAMQLQTQFDVLAALQERARLAAVRWQAGSAPYLEVLDAQRELYAAEQALVTIRRSLQGSGVSLYASLGGALTPIPELTESPTP